MSFIQGEVIYWHKINEEMVATRGNPWPLLYGEPQFQAIVSRIDRDTGTVTISDRKRVPFQMTLKPLVEVTQAYLLSLCCVWNIKGIFVLRP